MAYSAIITDATVGDRHLDNACSTPTSLREIHSGDTALDWVLSALAQVGVGQITYVGGYHIQKVMQRFPAIDYRFHANWRDEGELAAILLGNDGEFTDRLIIRASSICLPQALRRLTEFSSDITAAFYGQTAKSFAGIVAVPRATGEAFFQQVELLSRRGDNLGLHALVESIQLPVREVNVDGLAAPTHDRAAVGRLVFGGKGKTLQQLQPLVQQAVVLDQVRFTVAQWQQNPGRWLKRIRDVLPEDFLVVRSNTHAEDGLGSSYAGAFHSVLDVPRNDAKQIFAAVENVIDSYAGQDRSLDLRDEVLVQPQVRELAASGVILTRDMETGAPYYVINIDRSSGRSDTVTSGAAAEVETFYVSRDAREDALPDPVRRCVLIARESERLTGIDALDLEFGIDKYGRAYLFQLRPIAAQARKYQLSDDDLFTEVENARCFLESHQAPHPVLAGDTTIFGTMPDWNPAEMIGTAPRPLAISLYQFLIGNEAWAAARAIIGYRDCRPEPLIKSLGGRPYVDVRASLNSFLPADLDSNVAQRWVNFGLERIRENPELHDKIEFDVAVTCHTLDFSSDRRRMQCANLTDGEIADFKQQLLRLTDDALQGKRGSIDSQIAELNTLAVKRKQRLAHECPTRSALIARANALLHDCERHGTVAFSVLARYGFIAISFMRSLKSLGVFHEHEYEAILREIPTVASDLSRDVARHVQGILPADEFLATYGHLRPSSYDLNSPNYCSALRDYLNPAAHQCREPHYPDLAIARELFDSKSDAIRELLRENGFRASAGQLREFVLLAIQAREWGKFEFTKSLNAVLETLAEYGAAMRLSRDEISLLPISTLLVGASDSENGATRTQLRRLVEFNRKRWNLTSAIRLPHLIRGLEEMTAFRVNEWQPNFVTTRRIVGEPVVLEENEATGELEGRIVMIRAADPGYDWIFSRAIGGLITQYGGAASHMAIRAAEFGLPAAIGCGELIFERLRKSHWIELDCASKTVRGSDDHCGLDASNQQRRLLRTA